MVQAILVAIAIINSTIQDNYLIQVNEEVVIDDRDGDLNIYEECTLEDKWLFPLNKTNGLAYDYVPDLIQYNSNYQISPKIEQDLNNLLSELGSTGVNSYVLSAYRSYQTQENLFNNYVKNELAKAPGISLEEATIRANNYSAKPGHSEHQLGTTVDLNCAGCTPFAFYQSNLKLYSYLEENSYKFGFVISYPKDSKPITGYNYEPWHLRYIGKELANDYYLERSVDSTLTLDNYLSNKCLI